MQQTAYTELEAINNRCGDLPVDSNGRIDTIPMNHLMARNDGKGCVIIIQDGKNRPGVSVSKDSSGIYDKTRINRHDQ